MILYIGIPAALLIAFIVIMILFAKTPKENKDRRTGFKVAAIVAGALFAITAVFGVLIILLTMAIVANM